MLRAQSGNSIGSDCKPLAAFTSPKSIWSSPRQWPPCPAPLPPLTTPGTFTIPASVTPAQRALHLCKHPCQHLCSLPKQTCQALIPVLIWKGLAQPPDAEMSPPTTDRDVRLVRQGNNRSPNRGAGVTTLGWVRRVEPVQPEGSSSVGPRETHTATDLNPAVLDHLSRPSRCLPCRPGGGSWPPPPPPPPPTGFCNPRHR